MVPYKLCHKECHHAAAIFNIPVRAAGHALQVKTGDVDSFWSLLKQSIPKSVASQIEQVYHKAWWQYARNNQ